MPVAGLVMAPAPIIPSMVTSVITPMVAHMFSIAILVVTMMLAMAAITVMPMMFTVIPVGMAVGRMTVAVSMAMPVAVAITGQSDAHSCADGTPDEGAIMAAHLTANSGPDHGAKQTTDDLVVIMTGKGRRAGHHGNRQGATRYEFLHINLLFSQDPTACLCSSFGYSVISPA